MIYNVKTPIDELSNINDLVKEMLVEGLPIYLQEAFSENDSLPW